MNNDGHYISSQISLQNHWRSHAFWNKDNTYKKQYYCEYLYVSNWIAQFNLDTVLCNAEQNELNASSNLSC